MPTIHSLSGLEKREFRNALISAFPTMEKLNVMTEVVFNKRLNRIVSSGNIEFQAFELIGWAISQGKLEELMQGALNENPGNFELSEFLGKYNIVGNEADNRVDENTIKDKNLKDDSGKLLERETTHNKIKKEIAKYIKSELSDSFIKWNKAFQTLLKGKTKIKNNTITSDASNKNIYIQDVNKSKITINQIYLDELDKKPIDELKKIQKVVSILVKEISEKELSDKQNEKFKSIPILKFVNRSKEIDDLMSATDRSQYWLINAPAGYGKTELLKELDSKFKERNHTTLFFSITSDTTKRSVIDFFKKQYKYIENIDINNFGTELGHRNSVVLEQNKFILLIDFDKELNIDLLDWFQEIVKQIRRVFIHQNDYILHPDRFIVVFSGRYLFKYQHKAYQELTLSDFNYQNVRESCQNSQPNLNINALSLIAAHIMFLTGGHPLCISLGLQIIGDEPPGYMLEQRKQIFCTIKEIWEDIQTELVQKGKEIGADWLKDFLIISSVFRFFDIRIIKRIKDSLLNINKNEYDIDSVLRKISYLKWDNRNKIFSDGIVRNITIIYLREYEPKRFKELCEFAVDQCIYRINSFKHSVLDIWFQEYIYYSIQLREPDVYDDESRYVFIKDFYENGILNQGIVALKTRVQKEFNNNYKFKISQILETLIKTLSLGNDETDIELIFKLNYCLRIDADTYNDEPVNRLKTELTNSLNKT